METSRVSKQVPTLLSSGFARWRRRGAFVLLMLLAAGPFAGGICSADDLETSIAGFELKGKKPFEKLVMKDFEFIDTDSVRFVPVKRLLDALQIPFDEPGDSLRFTNPRGEEVCLLCSENKIGIDTTWKETILYYGQSDVTGKVDLFVPEEQIGSLCGFDLIWNESVYGYVVATEYSYPVWKRTLSDRKRGARRSRRPDPTANMPELFAATGPSRYGDPSLHFIQPGLRFSRNNHDRSMLSKSLNLWGRLAGGRYNLYIQQPEEDFQSRVSVSSARITHRLGNTETTLGDAAFGLSNLVFPTVALSGFEMNGMYGVRDELRDKDRTDFGRRDDFLASSDIVGTAPMGSKVALFINDHYLDEQTVEQQEWADPGDGVYRFENVDLLQDRASELRIEIVEPDGEVTYRTETRVGTGALLQPGQLLVRGGVGGRRFTVSDQVWKQQGLFGGARVAFGVTNFLSMGAVAATQDQFSIPYEVSDVGTISRSSESTLPTTSRHLGGELRFRFANKHTLILESAASHSVLEPERAGLSIEDTLSVPWSESGSDGTASRAQLNVHISSLLKISPQVFKFSPAYYNGAGTKVTDRQGYAVDSRLQFSRTFQVTIAHGSVADNLEHDSLWTSVQQWQHVNFTVPTIVPRTRIQVDGDRLEYDGKRNENSDQARPQTQSRYLGGLSIFSSVTRSLEFEADISAGNRLFEHNEPNLLTGISLPYSPSLSRPGWRAELLRNTASLGQYRVGHSRSEFRDRTYMSHTLRATSNNHWQTRSEFGYDWKQEDWFGQVEPGYYFDRTGTSRLSALARYQVGEWLFSVSLQLQPVFSFTGGRPFVVPYSQITPSRGGIRGIVFLDANGNGKRESGEHGLDNINVVTDGGRHVTTDQSGQFLLGAMQQRRRARVAIDTRTLSAIYTPTNGAQWCNIEPGLMTPVYLGVSELGSISGTVMVLDSSAEQQTRPLGGVVVMARDSKGKIVQESVTYTDGSYFLGDLLPGEYGVELRESSLPDRIESGAYGQTVRLEGNRIDISGLTIIATAKSRVSR
ncbi:MAG: hypothetical protein KDB65_08240 [Calditrichaeota bacterium]|nr:hypothetical protein [Calditrichota bacterium]MCB9369899.1 hypothetical protein [Calditrichota bacterium]